jgi:hypothetical protein
MAELSESIRIRASLKRRLKEVAFFNNTTVVELISEILEPTVAAMENRATDRRRADVRTSPVHPSK